MSFARTSIVLGPDDEMETRTQSYDGPAPVLVGSVIAVVQVGNLTIQSTVPGQLRRLAAALAEAEDRADYLRNRHQTGEVA